MANIKMKATNPDSIQCTLTITMGLGDRKRLKDQLKNENSYPAWQLRDGIYELVKQFQQEAEKEIDYSNGR